jgi:hypothetical protein
MVSSLLFVMVGGYPIIMVSERSMLASAGGIKSETWAADPGRTYHNGGLNIIPLMVSLPLTVFQNPENAVSSPASFLPLFDHPERTVRTMV